METIPVWNILKVLPIINPAKTFAFIHASVHHNQKERKEKERKL
jgi:hypothetical protein